MLYRSSITQLYTVAVSLLPSVVLLFPLFVSGDSRVSGSILKGCWIPFIPVAPVNLSADCKSSFSL